MVEGNGLFFEVFTGNSNVSLAEDVCRSVGIELGGLIAKRFSDGEINIEIISDVSSLDVFIIQSTCFPASDNLLELLLIVDALKRADARNIVAVLPYYGYARQDKRLSARTPIGAKLVADLLYVSGVTSLVTVELHSDQIQGFFDIPVHNLSVESVISSYFSSNQCQKNGGDFVVVSPDAGGMGRGRALAKELGCSLAFIDKYRSEPNKVSGTTVIGDVFGKSAIIYDDIVDTAGTLIKTAEILVKHGVSEVSACCIHPVMSGPAIDRIKNSVMNNFIVMDTIPLSKNALNCKKIKVVSVASLLGKSILNLVS